MSSKIRLLLLCPNFQILNGSKVIAALCKMVQRNVYNLQLPDGWLTLKTQDKLKFLAKSMPKGYELLMLREPKWTRRNKSLYQQVLRGDKGREVFASAIPQVQVRPTFDDLLMQQAAHIAGVIEPTPRPAPNSPFRPAVTSTVLFENPEFNWNVQAQALTNAPIPLEEPPTNERLRDFQRGIGRPEDVPTQQWVPEEHAELDTDLQRSRFASELRRAAQIASVTPRPRPRITRVTRTGRIRPIED
jgi:hypothetical protein